jgi:ubiquinone/menaquinone biosynthesis C-methylase UbiE
MTEKFATLLWGVYGNVYDGLLKFEPYTRLIREVSDYAGVQPGQKVLDFGCGTGNLIVAISAAKPGEIIGVDNSSSMVKVGRKKLAAQNIPNATMVKQDILEYLKTVPDETFDHIISINVVYALKNREELWRELLRIVRRTGKITIATSVKTDSSSLIGEQLQARGLLRSLHPALLSVAFIDALINLLGRSGEFAFPDEKTIRNEIQRAGGSMSPVVPAYAGVDITFSITRSS